MAEPYLIKKYSSRRLYDVAAGRFLTLDDVDDIIRQGRQIKVIDAKGKDATRGVLLQIVTEREAGREPLLSDDVLQEMVRLYGNAMHGPFGRVLEEAIASLREQRLAWQSALPDAFHQATRGVLGNLVGQQARWWKDAQAQWLGTSKMAPKSSRPASRRKQK